MKYKAHYEFDVEFEADSDEEAQNLQKITMGRVMEAVMVEKQTKMMLPDGTHLQ